MRRGFVPTVVALAALAAVLPGARAADIVAGAPRVIVSTTLNDTLQVFDAASLEQVQPPLPSKGGGPVRLDVESFGGRPYLFAANHGAPLGSVGVFDLTTPVILEMPLSPFPARAGSVAIDAATTGGRATVAVTNDWHALGGCGMPKGSVTFYDASALGSLGTLTELATVETTGALPYGVAIAPGGRAYASNNCSATLDTIALADATCTAIGCPEPGPGVRRSRATGSGPDGVVVDPASGLVYVVNISGNSVSVFDADGAEALTTVALPGARPIDVALADGGGGGRWIVTSNGGDDTISLVDRGLVEACVALALASCEAEVLRAATGVEGGAPEGVTFDPVTGRVFVVNKGIMAPSLTVLEIDEGGAVPTARKVGDVPLQAAGAGTPLPAVIAFDVVVAPPAP